jgi:hypothetical protein
LAGEKAMTAPTACRFSTGILYPYLPIYETRALGSQEPTESSLEIVDLTAGRGRQVDL